MIGFGVDLRVDVLYDVSYVGSKNRIQVDRIVT